MTRFNELLNSGALISRQLGILTGMQEQDGVTTIAPELMPILDPDGQLDRTGILYKLLGGHQPGLAAGGAGFRTQFSLDNPAGSGSIVTLERLEFCTGTAESLQVAWSAVPLTGSTGNLGWRDTRRILTPGFSGGFAARIRLQNNAALSGTAFNLDFVRVPLNITIKKNYQLVIAPGHSIRIHALADNVAIASEVYFVVRERQANDRELSF